MHTNKTMIMRTRVKVCGMTQAAQARTVINLGVDAIGMILHADSPRLIGAAAAKAIRAEVPAFVTLVGIFVDCDVAQVNDMASDISLDLVQLHGAETKDYASELTAPYIKAIRARSADQVAQQLSEHPTARALLLDPYVANKHGGTGQQLAVELWPTNGNQPGQSDESRQKLILAGGLCADNIVAAVEQFKPYAVDLNSGVEESPGVKDIEQLAQCLQLLKHL